MAAAFYCSTEESCRSWVRIPPGPPQPGRVGDNPAGLWILRPRFESAPGYHSHESEVVTGQNQNESLDYCRILTTIKKGKKRVPCLRRKGRRVMGFLRTLLLPRTVCRQKERAGVFSCSCQSSAPKLSPDPRIHKNHKRFRCVQNSAD